jgi:GntR family transcriptional repressor for pyruvate dehydrogenase complex
MGAMREQLSWLIEVDDATLKDLWEVRKAVELGIAQAAARNAAEGAFEKLDELMAKMEAASGDMKAYFRLAVSFHNEMALATGNRIFFLVWELFHDILLKGYVPILDRAFPGGPAELLKANKVLLDAIKSGDPDAIDRAMEEHAEAENIFFTDNTRHGGRKPLSKKEQRK